MDDARHATHPEGPCAATESTELPETFEEDTWTKLKVAIDAVHTETTVAYSREELYRVSGEDEPCTMNHHQAALRVVGVQPLP